MFSAFNLFCSRLFQLLEFGGLVEVFNIAEQCPPVIKAVAAVHIVTITGEGIVVLVNVALVAPLFHEQVAGFQRE